MPTRSTSPALPSKRLKASTSLKTSESIRDSEPSASTASSSDAYDTASSEEHAEEEEEAEEDNDSETSSITYQNSSSNSKKRKRPDAQTFSTSMNKILSSHLTTNLRKDPILVRSKQNPSKKLDDSLLEMKAKRMLSLEKKKELEKGRVRDVIPKGEDEGKVREVLERERALRKIAQRGVIRLFNAVREAQVRAELAGREAGKSGVVGRGNVAQKVTEMSKQGFLDLLQSGETRKK